MRRSRSNTSISWMCDAKRRVMATLDNLFPWKQWGMSSLNSTCRLSVGMEEKIPKLPHNFATCTECTTTQWHQTAGFQPRRPMSCPNREPHSRTMQPRTLSGPVVIVFLHNGCHILEIYTITSVYPEKWQSTENTCRNPATGHTYNFWKYTPFFGDFNFSVSGASKKGRVYAILCFTMPPLLCEIGKMRVKPSKHDRKLGVWRN